MTDHASDHPDPWAGRASGGAGAILGGTSGAASGTNGARLRARVWFALIALVILVVGVNVLTILDDAHRMGRSLPVIVPMTLEVSSGIAAIVAFGVIVLMVRLAPLTDGRNWRMVLAHFGGSLAYCIVHVGLMTLLRLGAFDAMGRRYPWSPTEFPYEYRKDLVTYVIAAIVMSLVLRGKAAAAPKPPAPALVTDEGPSSFDIRDGAALVRAPVREILAARAAGNYVEFMLEDGRRPLMRASLAAIEVQLAPHGLVRTHRSWLINSTRVRGLAPAGSGDFRVSLPGGLEAPVSRRYPTALSQLRGDA